MKTKNIKTVLVAVLLGLSLLSSAKIILSDYKFLRTEFSIHYKEIAQYFINSITN